jgi:hypothetical protein
MNRAAANRATEKSNSVGLILRAWKLIAGPLAWRQTIIARSARHDGVGFSRYFFWLYRFRGKAS